MAIPRILCVASQKGGAGKTSVSMLLADWLHHTRKSVKVLDLDPQCSAQKWESRSLPEYPRFPVSVFANKGLSPYQFATWMTSLPPTDYVIIDTPPNLMSGDLQSALHVADRVIVPFVPNVTSVDALEEMWEMVVAYGQRRGAPVDMRILPNKVDTRRSSERALVDNLPSISPAPVLRHRLRNLAAYADAANCRTSLYSMSSSKDARDALEAVAKEVFR